MTSAKLKNLLSKLQKNDDVLEDAAERKIIEQALKDIEQGKDFTKIVDTLGHEIYLYSCSHSFKLPKSLTELKLAISKNANKWRYAGFSVW